MNKKIFKIICLLLLILVIVGCKKDQYVIKFETNGGTEIENVEVIKDEVLVKPTDPTKQNYEFNGWYKDSTFNELYDFNTKVTSSFTLYAKWTELESYTVKFETNCKTTLKDVTIYIGGKLEEPKIENEGYNFDGWYLDKDFSSKFDFNTVLTNSLTLYAKWTEDATYAVYSVDLPKSYASYLVNKQTKTNKQSEFFDLAQPYYVGCDNCFDVSPVLTFIKKNNQTGEITTDVDVDSWSFSLKLYVLNNDSYEEVKDVNTYIDSFDDVNCLIDFAKDASGKKFKIEITPNNLTEKQQLDVSKYVISVEVEVIEGYNVYKANELAYIDNRTSGDYANSWIEFKQNNELNTTYAPSNLILHTDLALTTNDVPNFFFYSESEINKSDSDYTRAIGSMKDYAYFYLRTLADNETFTLQGNYFTINSSSFREVVRENNQITAEGEVISHATLFRFEGSESGKAKMCNINVIGNAPRVEDTIKAGGQILVKVEGPMYEAYNNITTCTFITYMPNYTFTEFTMTKCKAYDAFNCFVYNWGSSKVTIDSCEMIGAGGPVIIQDHVNSTDADGGKPGTIVIKNSTLESYVAGTEGWFSVVHATAFVPAIKQLDALFNPFNKSFLKKSTEDQSVTYMNLIAVVKSGSAQGISSEKIKGSITFDSSIFDFGETNPYIKALLEETYKNTAPAFQTSSSDLTSGYGYTDGKSGIFDVSNNLITDVNNNMYKGDYLCIYYSGMAFIFGYYDANQVVTME